MSTYSCSLCGKEGTVLPLPMPPEQWEEEQLYTCLCVWHDTMCFVALMDNDFRALAVNMILSAGEDLPSLASFNSLNSLDQDDLMQARMLAVFRISALGISPEDMEAFKVLVKEIPDGEHELDLKLRLLNFLTERKIIGDFDD